MDARGDPVAQDALCRDLQVQIRRCEHEVVDLEFLPRIDPRGAGFDGELPDCSDGDVGSPAVRDQVDLLHLGVARDQTQERSEVIDGELARLPIVGVAE